MPMGSFYITAFKFLSFLTYLCLPDSKNAVLPLGEISAHRLSAGWKSL